MRRFEIFGIICPMYKTMRDKFLNGVTVVLLLAIVACGLVMIYPTYKDEQNLKLRNAELQAKIDAKSRQIARLVEYQRRFRDDADFIEMIARRNRRVYPGELVFIFEDD